MRAATIIAIGLCLQTSLTADTGLTLSNQFLSWRVVTDQGKPTQAVLLNKISGQRHIFSLPAFGLTVNDISVKPADLQFVSASRHGHELVLTYSAAQPALQVVLHQKLSSDQPCLILQAEVSATDGQSLLVRRLFFGPYPVAGTCVSQGQGQPVCVGDVFLGTEHPAGLNQWTDGAALLTQCPAKRLATPLLSKPVALGVGGRDGGLVAFRRYLETRRVPPPARCPFVNYNTWWTLMPPTEKNCLDLLDRFGAKARALHGTSFDTFTIDDGWDVHDSLWAIDAATFPQGLSRIHERLNRLGSDFGLWISPSSGYSHGPWCEKQGYAVTPDSAAACLADPRYQRDMLARVQTLVRDYDLDFIKFDGFYAGVPKAGLDDIRNDPGAAMEANCDGYLRLLQGVRAQKPSIFLDPTCGMWLSPYWLFYVDSIWGSLGGDYPNAVVPAPIHKESATTTRDDYFIKRVRETPAFPSDAIETLGIIVITPEPWQNDAMSVLGRGTRLLTLYINPQFFASEADWEALGHMLRWAKANSATLAATELVGGEPTKREAYGFAHFRARRGILCLRNPWIAPQELAVKLGRELGSGNFRLRTLYPYREVSADTYRAGETFRVKLEGYEQRTLMLEHSAPAPQVVGCRYALERGAGGGTRCVLYGSPGDEAQVIEPGRSRRIAWPGRKPQVRIEQAQLTVTERPGGANVAAGTAQVVLPRGTAGSRLLILCETLGRQLVVPASEVTISGSPAKCDVVKPGEKEQGYWIAAPLAPGRNEIRYSLTFEGRARVTVSAWAEVCQALRDRTVDLDVPFRPGSDLSEPVPTSQAVSKQTYQVNAPVDVISRTWPDPTAKSMYLDTLDPDQSVQDWGEVQFRQSVWEKPMIIAGHRYDHGLGTHANGRLLYHLAGGGCNTFECEVGRDEHAGDGKIVFQVLLDGKLAFDSGPMTRGTPARAVRVDVSRAQKLELITADGGDGISGDHGDWADARLVR